MESNTYTIDSIKKDVSRFFDVDLSSKKRDMYHVRCRTIYYKVCFNLIPKATLTSIGKSVKRHHGSVINMINKFDSDILYDKDLKRMYYSIVEKHKEFGLKPIQIEDIQNIVSSQKEIIESLEKEINKIKSSDMVYCSDELKELNSLINEMSVEDQELMAFKLKALYNLNKNKRQEKK